MPQDIADSAKAFPIDLRVQVVEIAAQFVSRFANPLETALDRIPDHLVGVHIAVEIHPCRVSQNAVAITGDIRQAIKRTSEGIDGIPFGFSRHPRSQRASARDIDWPTHYFLEGLLNSPHRNDAPHPRRIDIDHDIDIAVWPIIASCDGAEQGSVNHPNSLKLGLVRPDGGDGVVACGHHRHSSIVSGFAGRLNRRQHHFQVGCRGFLNLGELCINGGLEIIDPVEEIDLQLRLVRLHLQLLGAQLSNISLYPAYLRLELRDLLAKQPDINIIRQFFYSVAVPGFFPGIACGSNFLRLATLRFGGHFPAARRSRATWRDCVPAASSSARATVDRLTPR